jgi:hypothetical protein
MSPNAALSPTVVGVRSTRSLRVKWKLSLTRFRGHQDYAAVLLTELPLKDNWTELVIV